MRGNLDRPLQPRIRLAARVHDHVGEHFVGQQLRQQVRGAGCRRPREICLRGSGEPDAVLRIGPGPLAAFIRAAKTGELHHLGQ
jgi:rhamnose utilization protein RhaD (predicted bifunctional aldolase and dehydrogenase)